MIIDFHTHIFPDKIARKTIDFLAQKGNVTPYSDGSVQGLLDALDSAGADLAVTLPVLTKPEQFDSVNRFAHEVNQHFDGMQIISFAGIHPHCEDIDSKMEFIKSSGFKGVKIHPDYQQTFINDPGYIRILENARDLDLIVVTHAGVDEGFRDSAIKCPPELVKQVIDRVHPKKFVLAHYGGYEMYDGVYDLLCGEDVYLDTAFILRYIDEATFIRILKKHGADRILFGSDLPWSEIRKDVEILKSFRLGKAVENMIFSENAKRLLSLK